MHMTFGSNYCLWARFIFPRETDNKFLYQNNYPFQVNVSVVLKILNADRCPVNLPLMVALTAKKPTMDIKTRLCLLATGL